MNGHLLRSGRVIPSRMLESGVNPEARILTVESRDTATHSNQREEQIKSSGASNSFYENRDEKICDENKTTNNPGPIKHHSNKEYAKSMNKSTSSRASVMKRHRLEAEYKAQQAIAEIEKNLILKQLELEQAKLDELEKESSDDVSEVSDPNRVDEWIRKSNQSTNSMLRERQDIPTGLSNQVQQDSFLPTAHTSHGNHVHAGFAQNGFPSKPEHPRLCMDDIHGKAAQPRSRIHDGVQNSNYLDAAPELRMFLARQGGLKELPAFSGDANEWPAFIMQYRRTTQLCGYSKDENMSRLQKCLKGRARETVAPLFAVPENLDMLIRILERRFGRPEVVVNQMIHKMQALNPIREDRVDSIIDLSNAVMGLVSTMQCLEAEGHMTNPHLIQELVAKLSPTLRLQWGSVAAREPVDLKDFSEWLLDVADAASYVQVPTSRVKEDRHIPPEKKHERFPPRREVVFSTSETHLKAACPCCEQKHNLDACSQFKNKLVDERWKFVKMKNLCFKCLKHFTFLTYDGKNDDILHEMVKQSFTTENFGVKLPEKTLMGKKDSRALEILEATTVRDGKRFETGLLWAKKSQDFVPSEKTALNRLQSMEKKMDKNPLFAEKYCEKIDEYVSKGYAHKLTDAELNERPTKWFLPHFAVMNENKPGKLRLVFDAAAKSHGVSLNDMLLSGPDLLVPLVSVLCKFRSHEVGFSGDIKEMFHQFTIRREDRAAQRFLWRGMNRTSPPSVYEMKAMTFGATSSPTTAQYIKNRNAMEWSQSYPEASAAIITKHYVDDYLDSASTENEATARVKEVIEVHSRGGFEIRNWASSSKHVLASIPPTLRAISDDQLIGSEDLPVERVLGVRWDPNKDVFCFRVKKQTEGGSCLAPTKRLVLQIVMSLFDPMGYLANFTIQAKILLQDVWRSAIGWDDELAGETLQKWMNWFSTLPAAEKIAIPRPYSVCMRKRQSVQLHVFCDASEQAFAAVAYMRITLPDRVDVAFLIGKTRVAPLRPISIPRLELQAAVMGARLASSLKNYHSIKFDETYLWSDSRTVLCWIRSDVRKYKQFVAHRVGEILETTEVGSWRWIPTTANVADDATRDVKPAELNSTSRWLLGPSFLHHPEHEWPKETKADMVLINSQFYEQEMKSECVAVCVQFEHAALPDISRFSSWLKLIRTTARVRKFIELTRKSTKDKQLTADDIRQAEIQWLSAAQWDKFAVELSLLSNSKQIPGKSRLLSLCPYVDDDGLMRVRGRIDNAVLSSTDKKRPIILDPKHPYTKLLIKHYHEIGRHCGQETVLNELRQRYWILDARSAVRSAWNACNLCRIRRSNPVVPEMGMLPTNRVVPSQRPFTFTGVDYFGPMYVTVRRRREKRYGVIFTCLATRAIHLELAASLTTDSCIMAINRFIGRRGQPLEFYSDNGRNLRGAERELREALSHLNTDDLYEKLSLRMMKWNFIPPGAPHMGGCWERLIRSVKTALRVSLKEVAPPEEVLQTLMIEAEAITNSRPLTHVSVDHEDHEALTPNHFLIGASSPSSCMVPSGLVPLRKQWRRAQTLADHFWRRWVREYLPTLTKRTKWFPQQRSININDLVIIADSNLPRGCWPRGKVVATYPGRDGIVRVVDVYTMYGTYRRPVSKLCPLELTT